MMMKLNKTTQLLCRCVELFHVSTNDQRFHSKRLILTMNERMSMIDSMRIIEIQPPPLVRD